MFGDEPADVSYFGSAKSSTASQPNRIEPKLGNAPIPLDVNMGRLVTLARVEEESIRPNCEDGRHRFTRIGLVTVLV
jgi:hypothetical protein